MSFHKAFAQRGRGVGSTFGSLFKSVIPKSHYDGMLSNNILGESEKKSVTKKKEKKEKNVGITKKKENKNNEKNVEIEKEKKTAVKRCCKTDIKVKEKKQKVDDIFSLKTN